MVVTKTTEHEGDTTCPVRVVCCVCGCVDEHDWVVTVDMNDEQRSDVARQHLTTYEGWRCDEDGDICPKCCVLIRESLS